MHKLETWHIWGAFPFSLRDVSPSCMEAGYWTADGMTFPCWYFQLNSEGSTYLQYKQEHHRNRLSAFDASCHSVTRPQATLWCHLGVLDEQSEKVNVKGWPRALRESSVGSQNKKTVSGSCGLSLWKEHSSERSFDAVKGRWTFFLQWHLCDGIFWCL